MMDHLSFLEKVNPPASGPRHSSGWLQNRGHHGLAGLAAVLEHLYYHFI
jgi:hypothetical protein